MSKVTQHNGQNTLDKISLHVCGTYKGGTVPRLLSIARSVQWKWVFISRAPCKTHSCFSHQSNCAMTTAAAPRGHSPWRESATTGCNSSSEKGCMPVTANANVVFYYVHLPQEFEKIANFPRFNAGHHLKALAYKCPRNRCQHLKFRADVAKIHQSCPVADKYVVSVEKMVPFTYIPYHSASITTGVVSGY